MTKQPKQYRVIWKNTKATVMVIEAYDARQAILRAANGSGISDLEFDAYEIGA